jgi:hypothetical protein
LAIFAIRSSGLRDTQYLASLFRFQGKNQPLTPAWT